MNTCEERWSKLQNNESFSYEKLKGLGTGSREVPTDYKTIVFPFDRYLITVKLTPDDKFIGIVEVRINKDFLSFQQKATPKGSHDVDEFYRE